MTNPVTPEEAVDSILEYCWALDFDGTPNDDIFHNPEKIAEIITAQRALAVEEYKTQVAEVYPQMIYFPELLETLGWQGGTIHQVIDEIKRLKEAEKASLWQPIETAPKGSRLMLLWGNDQVLFGKFSVSPMGGKVHKWYCAGMNRRIGNATSVEPTHWMPLPEPPQILTNCEKAPESRPEVIESFKQNLEKHSTLAKHLAQMEQADLPRHSSEEPGV
jgi:hypothetical protein